MKIVVILLVTVGILVAGYIAMYGLPSLGSLLTDMLTSPLKFLSGIGTLLSPVTTMFDNLTGLDTSALDPADLFGGFGMFTGEKTPLEALTDPVSAVFDFGTDNVPGPVGDAIGYANPVSWFS